MLFTVDVFNEGVDIPEVDTVLLLRPTSSATVFLQQLGRGLRLHEGKECLTVLDFIGMARREFRFDLRYGALLGGASRSVVQKAVHEQFPLLPSGCTITLDYKSRKIILGNLRYALGTRRHVLVRLLDELGSEADVRTFLGAAQLTPPAFYHNGRFLADLQRAAGFRVPDAGPNETALGRGLARLVHVDEPERLRFYKRAAEGRLSDPFAGSRARRRLMMLLCALIDSEAAGDLDGAYERLLRHPAICRELAQLMDYLSDHIRHRPGALDLGNEIPLAVHCSYSLTEIMAAFGVVHDGKLSRVREGVYFHRQTRCNLLLVTLRKSEKEYSPSTMYEDYAISRELFHWQSQHTTRATSKKGLRHIEHEQRGVTPLLFVRASKKSVYGTTEPYLFLGPVTYEEHSGERPMSIIWRMRTPIPADAVRMVRLAV